MNTVRRQIASILLQCTSLLLADFVAKVPLRPPDQGNSAIIESEWAVL
jgi:hypothetical protein